MVEFLEAIALLNSMKKTHQFLVLNPECCIENSVQHPDRQTRPVVFDRKDLLNSEHNHSMCRSCLV